MPYPSQAYTPPGLPIFPAIKTFEDARTAIARLQGYLQQSQTFNTTFFQQYFSGDAAQNTITYTPVLSGDGVAGTFTYSIQAGWVIAEGPKWTANFYLAWSAVAGGPTGNLRVSLPVPTANLNNCYWGGTVISHSGITYSSGYTYLALQAPWNSLFTQVVQNGSGQNAQYLPMTGVGTTGWLVGQITYRTP